MGIQVDCKSYFPGYLSMRNLNEDSSSSSWPLFCGDKTSTNGQFYNGYMPRSIGDACVEYDKDTLKQKMLEHEAVFRKQVYELHRLYRIQRDMMEDIRRKEIHGRPVSIEPSSSSSLRGSQMPSEDSRKRHMPNFPWSNSCHPGPSMSGADMVSSPLSCTKGSNCRAGLVSGSISKDREVIECRLSKVRKKLFDLQLPADEYIDNEEGKLFHGSNVSNISNFLPNRDKSEKHEKFFLNGCNGERFGGQWDASTSDSCPRSSVRLADLNEPAPVEDEMLPSSIDCLLNAANHVEGEGLNYSVKPGSQFLASQKRITRNTEKRNLTGSMDDAVSIKGKGREWRWDMYDSGLKKNNLISMPLSLQQDHLSLPSKPPEGMLNKGSPPLLPKDRRLDYFWRERTACNMEDPVRIHENPHYNHLESIMTSQTPRQYQYSSPLEMTNSWSHSGLSWAKPTNSLTEKPSSYQLYPSLNSSTDPCKSIQSSALSHSIVGEKWHSNGCSRLLPGSVDLPVTNGFYHGSSSGSKERLAHYPSKTTFGHLDSNGVANDVHIHSVDHELEAVMKGPNYMEAKPRKDLDLNLLRSKCTSHEAVGTQNVEVINEKPRPEGRVPSLPWLRAKPNCRTEAVNVGRNAGSEASNLSKASPSKFFQANEPSNYFNKVVDPKGTTIRSESEKYAKKEIGDANGVGKILGVPIYDYISTSRIENSSSMSTSVTRHHCLPCEELPSEGKKRVIDINIACDEQTECEVQALKELERKVTPTRIRIDLNSCISEEAEEERLGPFARHTDNKKIVAEIDLGAPVPEMDDDLLLVDQHHENSLQSAEPKPEHESEEHAQMAAEAIILLSLSTHPVQTKVKSSQSTEDALPYSLLWFADVICDSSDTKESKGNKEIKGLDGLLVRNRSSELDDFEIMTLQLQETKEEDYMPTPFFHEVQNMEDTGATTVPTRGRKPSNRGRQRRDFQRDILPGLASLSRHEVTEDLQTFGGLMKATGQNWSAGLTRRTCTRNGCCARGRRRAVVGKVSTVVASVPSSSCTPLIQQINSIESGLEDRSLTGWGKTTRRPRRQRCPAGNPLTVALTR